ncbi:hypothetical protein GCM10023231_01800 [Olivibacter ginsenosidimutans]|uniref:RNA polymerase sigma-70 factor n=1 Tax=Olivibacter ginsenosidimutans TaxID=1176537 RepID=A0ABP9AC75_9SPHI
METGQWTFQKIASFKRLFQFYWERVFAHCLFYSKDLNTSKDLTQNIFLDLWERGKEFPDQESLEKYLSRCAKYQVLNYFHYQNTTQRCPIEDIPEQPDYRNNPEYLFQYKQLAENLERLIDSLREPCRTVFCMSRKQNLSHKAISNQMGISISTVEYHMSNALRYLRKQLEAQR